ncbi:MAG: YkgJ family cysteine cluster protein [Chthoniobacteraceae bacterium]
MPVHTSREELLGLATAFRDAAAEELKRAETASDIHAVTLRAHARLNELETQLFAEHRVRVDCKAGCGTCCHLGKIDARAHEIFALADWITRNFSAEDRDAVLQRARAHAAAVAPLTLEQHLRTVRACPLLRDMSCSAHAGRPGVCRIGHSTDVRICERAFQNPDDLAAKGGSHAVSKLAMTVASDGTSFAFLDAGLDKTVYDLGSALAEALGDPTTQERWLAGGQAFSKAAIAKQEPSANG